MDPVVDQIIKHVEDGTTNIYILQCYFNMGPNRNVHKHIRGFYTNQKAFYKGLDKLKYELMRETWWTSRMILEGHIVPTNEFGFGWLDNDENRFYREEYTYLLQENEEVFDGYE